MKITLGKALHYQMDPLHVHSFNYFTVEQALQQAWPVNTKGTAPVTHKLLSSFSRRADFKQFGMNTVAIHNIKMTGRNPSGK